MRSDMFHVIIDRPRVGGDGGNSIKPKGYKKQLQRKLREEEIDLPVKESAGRFKQYKFSAKELNEHLSPLYRYLQKQTGRPWNDVYSEICKNLSVNSAVKSHVRDHANQYVEQNVVMHYNKPYKNGYEITYNFYVNDEGILCKAEEPTKGNRTYKQKQKKNFIQNEKNPNIQYHKINDIWYEIELESCEGKTSVNDVVLQKSVYLGEIRWSSEKYSLLDTYGKFVYGKSKRQLNKREIKRILKGKPC